MLGGPRKPPFAPTPTIMITSSSSSAGSRPRWGISLLFSVALAIGSWAILNDAPLWLIVSPVAVFAIALLLNGMGKDGSDFWLGSAADAPYFLGFLLTLVALYHTLAYSAVIAVSSHPNPGLLLSAAGSALLPTGVGLFSRQLLLTYGDHAAGGAAARNDATLSTIAESLSALIDLTKQSLLRDEVMLEKTMSRLATEFERIRADAIIGDIQRVHKEMVVVLEEFISQRREFMADEDAARKTYIGSIAQVGRELNTISETLNSGSAGLETASELIRTSLTSVAAPLASTGQRAAKSFDAIEVSLGNFNKGLVAQNAEITGATTVMADIVTQSKLITADLESGRKTLDRVFLDLGKVPDGLLQTASEVDKAGKQLGHAVQTVVTPIHKEAKEIDRLIGDLTSILTRRVNDLGALK